LVPLADLQELFPGGFEPSRCVDADLVILNRGLCHLEVPIILDEESPLDELPDVLGDSLLS